MASAKKIYVVEDEDSVRNLLETGLKYFGYEVYTTSNPLKALEEEEQFDIYVIDLALPWLDGFELIDKLRKKFGTIKTVVITGNPIRLTAANKSKVDRFLVKPCKFQTILDTIRSLEENGSAKKPDKSKPKAAQKQSKKK